MKLKVEGFEETDRNLASLHEMTDEGDLRELGFDALQPVAETARSLVRQRTGTLQRSIGVGDQLSPAQTAANRPEPNTIEIYVGPGPLPQAITEEFGTVDEIAHPFMRPAWDTQLGTVTARLQDGAGKRLRRIVKG